MFSCLDIENIDNPSLKRLLSIRCNRSTIFKNIEKKDIEIFKILLIFLILTFVIYKIFNFKRKVKN